MDRWWWLNLIAANVTFLLRGSVKDATYVHRIPNNREAPKIWISRVISQVHERMFSRIWVELDYR
jgi:hypothetical protein